MKSPIEFEFVGQRFRAVGRRLYRGKQTETDHEFYIHVLQTTFHPGWYQQERQKPGVERHVVANWYASYCQWQKEHSTDKNRITGGWAAYPSGDVQSLLVLAYDLYCADHSMALPKKLLDRLRNKDSFQGARYELAIISILVQLDYAIEYPKDKGKKTCELIARNKSTGECFGVEAKSRHREGVLHQPGSPQQLEAVKVGVTGRLNEAISQRPSGVPFVVFIDLNLPPSGKPPMEKPWLDDIKRAIEHQGEISEQNPEKFSALFITNFSYHYEGQAIIDTGKYSTDVLTIVPQFSEQPFKRLGMLADLALAVQQYGHVPDRNDKTDLSKVALGNLQKRISFIQEFWRFLNAPKMKTTNPPTITSILVCREIVMDGNAMDLKQVGHTILSMSGQGTVDLAVYVEGHGFNPGTLKLKVTISDEGGNKVSDPPLVDATVSENGIFETKLILTSHIPFKPGRYEVRASVENGPMGVTELFMIA